EWRVEQPLSAGTHTTPAPGEPAWANGDGSSQAPVEPDSPAAGLPDNPAASPERAALDQLIRQLAAGAAPVRPANPATQTPQVAAGLDVTLDPRFQTAQQRMQYGAWPQVVEMLRALQADYPHATLLDPLLAEAELKAALMVEWADKIKGRRLTVGQAWLLRRSIPFLLVLGLFLGAAIFYQNFVAPSRQVVAMVRQNQELVDEATALLKSGRFDEAVALYQEVLARDPHFAPAHEGLAEAHHQINLALRYDIALQVAEAGNVPRALKLLTSIQQQTTAYRDVDAQLGRLQGLLQVDQLFAAAERAYAQHRWLDAVHGYEQVQSMAASYRAAEVVQRLNEAYLYAGQALLASWPVEGAGPKEARDYLRKAQAAGVASETVAAELALVEVYLKGERAYEAEDFLDAINYWRGIFDERPGYLGGFLAEQLYQAYLALGDQKAASGSTDYARELFTLATALPVKDTSEAQARLQGLAVAQPTPAPTPTPPPVAYAPPAAVPVAAAPPAPEPTPTPTPVSNFQGWIAFRTTRNGSEEVFVMRPDGSEAQPAPESVRSQLDLLYQKEQWSPDGSRHVIVQSAQGRSDANLYIAGAEVTDAVAQGIPPVTNFNEDEYDPVWSPDGQWIAFVSNHTYNDEIWLMRADGSEQRQLTHNEWEWDKHPTWSPDSGQIAFFSNRTGKRQIWVMNSDGSNARNLSNNPYDDWDPVWLK
ncbi:MAG TPA: tetratricopeptide repeat protein, partial [Caldilineaceae bacterium]|nr:tetratricopeptide repeat protein [Caldilineaceae bacterium]